VKSTKSRGIIEEIARTLRLEMCRSLKCKFRWSGRARTNEQGIGATAVTIRGTTKFECEFGLTNILPRPGPTFWKKRTPD